MKLFENMKCVETSDKIHEICTRPHIDNQPKSFLQEYLSETYTKSITFTFNIYQNRNSINIDEYQYLNLLEKILKDGIETQSRNSRVLSTFGERMIFDLSESFLS